jgi:hypothetical protein
MVKVLANLVDFQKVECFLRSPFKSLSCSSHSRTLPRRYPGSETASDFAGLANISQMGIISILYNMYTIFAFHKVSSYLLGVTMCTVVLALAVTLNGEILAFSNQFTLGNPWGGGPKACSGNQAWALCANDTTLQHESFNVTILPRAYPVLLPLLIGLILISLRSVRNHLVERFKKSAGLRTGALTVTHLYSQIVFPTLSGFELQLLHRSLSVTTNRTDRSFGQVVAVLIWVPSIADFCARNCLSGGTAEV